MAADDKALTNHTITICLEGGAVLGPFRATWSKDIVSDVRELVREYDAFLKGEGQPRFKFHLHDRAAHLSHTIVVDFRRVTAIYDKVDLHD
ncbi:MAG: hypothetical protein RIB46_03170 [Pseudomonadales bacterium]|jgi:hypothetical protein